MTTLQDTAMLVRLSISQWYNKATDPRLVEEIAEKYGVEADGRDDVYVKRLLPAAAMRNINKAVSALRAFHTANTLPWQDNSVRILSSENFFAYRNGMQELKEEFERAVDEFVSNYPKWVEHARKTKKGLFDEAQYPSVTGLRKHFDVKISLLPFPNTQDFRIPALNEAEQQKIREEAWAGIQETLQSAKKHLYTRLYERAYLLHTALVEERAFRDSTVLLLRDTAEQVQRLNITEDPDLERAATTALELTAGFTPDTLRQDSALRNRVAKELAEYMAALKEATL